MKKESSESLLGDVLAPVWETGDREQMLARARGTARSRRRMRRVSGGAALIALLAACVSLLWRPTDVPTPTPTAYTTVRTQPLADELVVHTQPTVVLTNAAAGESFTLVRTDFTRPAYRALTNDELLAMFAGQSVMLVGGPGETRLFLNGRPVGSGAEFPAGGRL